MNIFMYKQYIRFLVCSWNHEYLGFLAKLTWSLKSFTYFANHDSMNIPKLEIISLFQMQNYFIKYFKTSF